LTKILSASRFILLITLVFIISHGCSKSFITDDELNSVKKSAQSYKSENWETRKEAISKICSFNTPEAETLLIEALNDSHSSVKIEALKCVSIKKPANAKRLIKEIAEFETDSNIRMYAIRSLATYRDPTDAPVFAKGLANDDWLLREESIKGMLQITDLFIQKISVPYIIQALKDTRINVRLAAIENLNFKDERIYKELAAIINNEDNYNKINLLNITLKSIHGYLLDQKTRARLIEFLAHPNREIRIISLSVLKKDKELQQY